MSTQYGRVQRCPQPVEKGRKRETLEVPVKEPRMIAKAMSIPPLRWLGLVGPIALAWLGGCSAETNGPGPGGMQGTAGTTGIGGTGSMTAGCETPKPGKAQIRRLT